MDLFGTDSAFVADVDLQVAAAETRRRRRRGDIVPLAAAAVALVAAVGGLVSVAGRQRTAAADQPPRVACRPVRHRRARPRRRALTQPARGPRGPLGEPASG